jgi:hypothetical protein
MDEHRFARVTFSVFDGRQRLGHAIESMVVKKGFDVYIGDRFIGTVRTREEARAALLAALNDPEAQNESAS